MAHILHLIKHFAGDGPTRSLITLGKVQAELGYEHTHRVVTLETQAYPLALVQARQAGMNILRAPSDAQLSEQLATADIVQIHFWNHPALYQTLRRPWPAARVLLRLSVLGLYAPQAITAALVDFADCCMATSEATMTSPLMAAARAKRTILATMDFDRLADCHPQPHDGFRVGYVGTINYGKLHADFVAMCDGIHLPDVRFILCGNVDAAVQRDVEQSVHRERFDLRGFVEEIGSVLSQLDLFGYPLASETYATSEKSLQEAMYAGVPPVVLHHAGLDHLVQHNVTGLVVGSTDEYIRAIEYLYHHPEERLRLAKNARAYARSHFAPKSNARQIGQVYAEMMAQPKRERHWTGAPLGATPAHYFVDAMGATVSQFGVSLTSEDPDQIRAADTEIAASSTLLAGGEGGLFHYRNAFPADPWLRYWSGLILFGQGRYAKARAEFQAASAGGVDKRRVDPYLEQSEELLANQ